MTLKDLYSNEHALLKLADFFAIFGDYTRVRILALLRIKEQNVGNLADQLNMSVSAVSHQLKLLKNHDLVRMRRNGKYIFYYLSDEHVEEIFDLGLAHLYEKNFR